MQYGNLKIQWYSIYQQYNIFTKIYIFTTYKLTYSDNVTTCGNATLQHCIHILIINQDNNYE